MITVQRNQHSHEITRCWVRITIRSSLHEPVRIFGSSRLSVFESPPYQLHNKHKFGSGPDLMSGSVTLQHTIKHLNRYPTTHDHAIHMHTFTIHTHPHTYMYTLISNTHSFTQHTLTHPTNTQ